MKLFETIGNTEQRCIRGIGSAYRFVSLHVVWYCHKHNTFFGELNRYHLEKLEKENASASILMDDQSILT